MQQKEEIALKHIVKTYTVPHTDIIVDHAAVPDRIQTVLQDLNLTIPCGQITVIVGRSGCGKSTLLRLLHGETEADSGEICLPEGWHTALLCPDPYVITWTSVLRNVALAGGAGRTPEERMALAEELVRLVGLEAYADLTPVALSTGMKQRLGLARVLASQAQLLLLDEPFASLDFITREELQNELLAIQARMPRSIVLVTHQLDEALLLGEKIIVMHTDSSLRSFDLSALPYPRDLDTPMLRQLRREITEECRK